MTYLFWIIVVALCAFSLGWVFRALWDTSDPSHDSHEAQLGGIYRDRLQWLQAQYDNGEIDRTEYDTSRGELEAALAAELPDADAPGPDATVRNRRLRNGTIAVLLPAAAVATYLWLGEPGVLSGSGAAQQAQAPSIETMVARLEARLEADPDDVEGWAMLGRSYTALGKPAKARDAYAKAVELAPDNPGLLLDYAEAIARTRANTLTGEPKMLIDKALQLNPESMRARLLAGVADFQAGDRQAATERWVALLNDPDTTEQERQLLNRFLAKAGEQSAAAEQAPAAGGGGKADAGITVRVTLADALRERVDDGDTLFIYARAPSGPPMPVAIEQHKAGDLPLEVVLDDDDAMMAQMKLSGVQNVVVLARISKTGNAQPSSGDLQTTSGTLDPATSPEIELTIDQVVP